ncbi:hypothetical protein Pst134EB_025011 [Puccinia striiformis f. sp. tritici]|nr:hypothetical protein Pst134EB_025011 [Puccinia striiformis f. sp. tritici]
MALNTVVDTPAKTGIPAFRNGSEQLNERQAIPAIFPVSTSERHTRILRDRDHASVVGSTIAELIRHQLSFTKMVLDATITYPNESDHIRKAVGINAGQVVNIQMKSCPEGIPPPTDIKGSTPSFPLLPTVFLKTQS